MILNEFPGPANYGYGMAEFYANCTKLKEDVHREMLDLRRQKDPRQKYKFQFLKFYRRHFFDEDISIPKGKYVPVHTQIRQSLMYVCTNKYANFLCP